MTTSAVKPTKAVFQDQAIFKRSYWSPGKVIAFLLLLGIILSFRGWGGRRWGGSLIGWGLHDRRSRYNHQFYGFP